MSNSENTPNGKKFQEAVCEWFASKHEYKGIFEMEVGLPIGSPKKDHFFDIVNKEAKIVIECKRYTWTETGNVPSAKIRSLNEAAFFLTSMEPSLKDSYTKYIVMFKANHPKKKESLAEYYFKTYHHLLGDIILAEYDVIKKEMRYFK
ncbi:MAG: hypothetical protein K5979_13190 [Ruminococcus sp.]|nr:hypothetical protein [Ruminococcus sp.]